MQREFGQATSKNLESIMENNLQAFANLIINIFT